MKLLLQSLLLIACVPFLSLALEPVHPESVCNRFIGETDIKSCETRAQKDNVDWYAVSLCNLQKEDSAFWACWDQVKDKKIKPQALKSCVGDENFSDEQRQSCLEGALSNGRMPASSESKSDIFQPLKIKGR